MGNPYTEPTLTGYNANPPSDDGSEVASNEVTWAKPKDKIGDPLKNYAAAISTNALAAFALLPFRTVSAVSTNTTITTSDRGKFYNLTSSPTLTLPAAATAGDGFTISGQNTGTGTVTIDGDSTETINTLETVEIYPGGGFIVTTDGANWIAIIQNSGSTGEMIQTFETSKPGYLLMYGQTMGNTDSGGTLAAAKYWPLFEFLWDNVADAQAAVSTGRGTTAAVDWSNDKTITVPDMRGRGFLGKDNMGGASANVVTGAEADTVADVSGAEDHTQILAEIAVHAHKTGVAGTGNITSGGATNLGTSINPSESVGSGTAMNIMNPYMTFNVFIRY